MQRWREMEDAMTGALLLAGCWVLAYFRAGLRVWTAAVAAVLLFWSMTTQGMGACLVL